ncbi:MAG: histidinol-phosphatase family [Actinomycetota bacterium]|jgi:histidinol-phosphatase (PHP family)|nr:histidinol-phosphatase family [Actinomycetota bacterium]
MIDLHTHLWRHEPGTPMPSYDQLARSCEFAATRGVEQIAITEHCNRFEEIADVALPLWRRTGSSELQAAADHVWSTERGAHLDDYVELLTTAQERGLPLLVGLEVDHLPGANDAVAAVLDAYPFDVLLGSVHWLGAWLFDAYGNPTFAREWEDRSVDDVWTAYVDAVIELARSGLVDVLAHVDVVKVTGRRPDGLAAFEARLCAGIASTGVVVEVSSAGLRKPAHELYPSLGLLGLLHEAGVAFTTASDAHGIDQLGVDLDTVRIELDRIGVETLATFVGRERVSIAVD